MATLREHLGHRGAGHRSDDMHTHDAHDMPVVRDDVGPGTADQVTTTAPVATHPGEPVVLTDTAAAHHAEETRREDYEQRVITRKARTSGTATFALVFGLAAIFCAIVAIFAPIAVLLGIVALLLGLGSWSATGKPGITGRTLGLGGLLLGAVAIVLGGAVVLGVTTAFNDSGTLDRLERRVEQLRDQLPSVDVNVDR